jgi:hypothetical protein
MKRLRSVPLVLGTAVTVAALCLPRVSRGGLITPSAALTQTNCNPRPGQGNASYTIGSKFQVGASALVITALGVEDDNGYVANGGFGDGLISSHVVSLWASTDTSTPLASVTVPAGTSATFDNGFRYAGLGVPVQLAAGGTYYIGAWFTDPINANDTFYNPNLGTYPAAAFTFDAAVTGLEATYSLNGSFLNPACPTNSGNPLGGWAGASAQFTVVPEPSLPLLLGVGLSVLLCAVRCRRRPG